MAPCKQFCSVPVALVGLVLDFSRTRFMEIAVLYTVATLVTIFLPGFASSQGFIY